MNTKIIDELCYKGNKINIWNSKKFQKWVKKHRQELESEYLVGGHFKFWDKEDWFIQIYLEKYKGW